MSGIKQTIVASLALAFVSTFADAFWAAGELEHRAVYGVVHGGLVLAALGMVLGRVAGRPRAAWLGALGGLAIGIAAAAAFYVLYGVVGVAAMFVAWMGLWIAFAILNRALADDGETMSRALTRGCVAALLSGIAFYSISGIWFGSISPGPFYIWFFLCWTVAFLPGFGALLMGRDRSATAA